MIVVSSQKHPWQTVSEAIIAFLESKGFEDAIRNAISLGGDSDTLAAITGSIAEAAYGIPKEIADKLVHAHKLCDDLSRGEIYFSSESTIFMPFSKHQS